MTQRYEMSYEAPLEMVNRAMTSWAQGKLTRRQKALRIGAFLLGCAVFGGLLGFSGVLDALPDYFLIALLIGFYLGFGVLFALHRWNMKKLSGMMADQFAKQGVTHAVFSAEGVTFRSNNGSAQSTWAGYDEVIAMADATVLRSGGVVYPVPHFAVPQGVEVATFHADLVRWQKAAS